MRKASKIILLIWDILLIPAIIAVLAAVLDFHLPFEPSFNIFARIIMCLLYFYLLTVYLIIAFSELFIPQIITLVLITLNWVMPFRRQEPRPTKKEIRQIILLSFVGFIGAVCAFISLILMSRGEMGAPLP